MLLFFNEDYPVQTRKHNSPYLTVGHSRQLNHWHTINMWYDAALVSSQYWRLAFGTWNLPFLLVKWMGGHSLLAKWGLFWLQHCLTVLLSFRIRKSFYFLYYVYKFILRKYPKLSAVEVITVNVLNPLFFGVLEHLHYRMIYESSQAP